MNDTERIIGQLQAHHEHSQKRFDKLEEKVDSLWVFRWKIAGGTMAVAALVSAIFQLLRR